MWWHSAKQQNCSSHGFVESGERLSLVPSKPLCGAASQFQSFARCTAYRLDFVRHAVHGLGRSYATAKTTGAWICHYKVI